MSWLDTYKKRWPQWFGGKADWRILNVSLWNIDRREIIAEVTVKNAGTGYESERIVIFGPDGSMAVKHIGLQAGETRKIPVTIEVPFSKRLGLDTVQLTAKIDDERTVVDFESPRENWIYLASDPEAFEAKVGHEMYKKWRDEEISLAEFRQGTARGYGVGNLVFAPGGVSNVKSTEDVLSRSTNASSVLF